MARMKLVKCALILVLISYSNCQKDVKKVGEGEWDMGELTADEEITSERTFTFDELMQERRSQKSISLGQSVSGKSAMSLCRKFYREVGLGSTKYPTFKYINIKKSPKTITTFYSNFPCVKWAIVPCEGMATGNFDPECSYWMPKKAESSCSGRSASSGDDNLILNGLDVATLCSSVRALKTSVMYKSVVMKTDEESDLRCIEWESHNGIWSSRRLSKYDCDKANKYRTMVFGDVKFVGSYGSEDMSCWNQGGSINCRFDVWN